MTEKEKNNYNRYRWFLEQVEPYEGFEVEDYYGVMYMTVMRNGTFDIKLQYDYKSTAKNSSAFKVETIEEVVEWILLLDSFKNDKSTAIKPKKYDEAKAIDYTDDSVNF